jgi:transposase
LPNAAAIRSELQNHKNLTLSIVWTEYKASHPEDGLQYSQFCQRYRTWEKTLDLVLRQPRRAGEKLFIDYAGDRIPIHDPKTGAVHMASLFVCALGVSNYTYAEATYKQDAHSFAQAHVHALAFMGGVPEILVPDNTKAAVIKPSFYEPELHRTYRELAEHYGCVVVPARPYRPRDKSTAESAVQVAQRWILAVLRHHTFFSLAEANEAILVHLDRLNNRPFQKLEGSRKSQFESIDKPALRPLPPTPYVVGIWKKARVHLDYHVQVDHCYYSVPFTLVREEVDVRLTDTTVEIFHRGKRVAVHKRLYGKGKFTTDIAHCPESHRRHLAWSPQRLASWAESVGPETARLVAVILESHTHPEQGYRSCLGIMRLAKRYPAERVELASARALAIGARSYRSVKTILEKGLDQVPPEPSDEQPALPPHKNVRGPEYFRGGDTRGASGADLHADA